ncbi:MAG: hypothetical protein WC455_25985 [Dehalococcoidia bacterium]|jgi:hypothetical protein
MKKTPLEVRRWIIDMYEAGKKQDEISAETGVNQATVSRVLADAVTSGLILPRPKAKGTRRMSETCFLEIYSDPCIRGILRKEINHRHDREDALQAAWERIITLEDGKGTGYYVNAGKWAIRNFYERETLHKRLLVIEEVINET